jgi:uncharacterized protein
MKEIRTIEGSELRTLPESRKIEGYALLFNVESQDLGGFRELITPEALNGVLEKSDVLALYNHNDSDVLARYTKGEGTLRLFADEKGLKYSFDAPNTPLGEEVLDAIRRGDLRNSSFAFTVDQNGQKWQKREQEYIRTITQFDKLWDCSPVYRPAYEDTSVAARSLDSIKNELDGVLDEDVEVISDEPTSEQITDNEPDITTEEEISEPELIEIFYNNNSYNVPRHLIEDFIVKGDSQRALDEYFNDLERTVHQLKK